MLESNLFSENKNESEETFAFSSEIDIQDSLKETLPNPAFLQALHTRNGTNMRRFVLASKEPLLTKHEAPEDKMLFTNVLYVVLALVFLVIVVLATILLVRRHYSRQERNKVIVVRSLKNEREEDRRKDDLRAKSMRPSGSPVTLNSESNLQTIKVKTLAVTVRNNLEEFGTEV